MAHARRRTRPARRRGFPWGLAAIVGVFAVVVVAVAVQVFAPHSASSGGISLGSAPPPLARYTTTGGSLSLDQLRGSKVVVYFYEGSG